MIDSLAYVGFRSPRAEAWLAFGPEVLGLEVAGRGPDGAVRLRMDAAAQRIVVHPGERDDLAYLGWAVAGPAALEATVRAVEKQGIAVERGDAELAALRAVTDVAWFVDPFGFRHELAVGLATASTPFRPGRPIAGFVTGAGGLGHAVLILPDTAEALRFYGDALGFRLSDRIDEHGMHLTFLHCNPRHHSIAFAAVPGAAGMHHLMLEVASLDDVATGLEICKARGLTLAMDLGKHPNDEMTSFYVRSPSGFEIEYGFGGRLVDDATWVVGHYDVMSLWGHEPPATPLLPGILRPFAPPVRAR